MPESVATHPLPTVPVAAYLRMSTDMQVYSILNQSLAISAYAEAHGMRIVRTYRDDGRSGLTIEHRPGLLALMRDIGTGRVPYGTILVLDVSRWGRFQNVDEAAHYEFLCWRAGVRVCYVAELFENDGTPFAMIVKGLKRAMAAEYSRELSGKTTAAHRTMAARGFHQGSSPGYGLRRMLIDEHGNKRMMLGTGDRKGKTTDRVVLVPGPLKERRTVQWIFERCAAGMGYTDIARALNAKGSTSARGKAWSYGSVRNVVESERYIGNLVYGRERKRLGGPLEQNASSSWVRCEGAIPALVTRELFDAAHRAHKARGEHPGNEELVARARLLLEREGRLSIPLINADPALPESHSVSRRFGGLTKLYRLLGFVQPRNANVADSRAMITRWRRSVTAFVRDWLDEEGSVVIQNGWQLRIDDAWTVSFSVVNAVGENKHTWFNHRLPEPTDIVVFVRARLGAPVPDDYLVLPRVLFPRWPRSFYKRNGPLIDQCTYPSLAILGDLARLSRRRGG